MSQYKLGRYITASEGYWCIYNFPIQCKHPPVEMLTIHLENAQVITFSDNGEAQTLLGFDAISQHPDMHLVLYQDVFKPSLPLYVKEISVAEEKTEFSGQPKG